MGKWTRQELDAAFEQFRRISDECIARTDYVGFFESCYTADAVYVEHHLGVFEGREAMKAWGRDQERDWPDMYFEWDWWIIDEERGWVIFQIQNCLPDVDGSNGGPYKSPSWQLIKYAGDNRWSYEEDMYNPNEIVPQVEAFMKAKAGLAATDQ